MRKSRVEGAHRIRPAAGLVDEGEAWDFVRSLLEGGSVPGNARLGLSSRNHGDSLWQAPSGVTAEAGRLLDLCVPLCVGARAANLVVAHLGQSLDGRVAVPVGHPRLITGPEDLRHTHRLRALCDAVIVGATTVAVDDPQLTTRLVSGAHPTRVVLDPRARLARDRRVFTDGQAPSLVVVGDEHAREYTREGSVEVVTLALSGDSIPITAILAALRQRGLRRLFVEGGGVTVSRFLDAGVLDRLHVAVASRIVGTGAPAIQLDAVLAAGGVAASARSYLLGGDVLFDCDLRATATSGRGGA